MADQHTYRPDTAGNPMKDPDFEVYYQALTEEELRLTDAISASVNEKISHLVDPAPFAYRYFKSFSIAAVGLLIICAIVFWPESPVQKAFLNEKPHTDKGTPTQISQHRQEQVTQKNETPTADKQQNNPIPENPEARQIALSPEAPTQPLPILAEEALVNEQSEKSNVEALPEPVQKTDNTRKMVEEENKTIFLRVASAQVMSKVDLASLSGTKNTNTDVTNPQIGGKTITKNPGTSASLEDYPTHKGGDQGLSSYIARNLNNRIYIRKNSAVYNVNVSFEVNAKGKVEHVEVLDKVPAPMELEIKQVIENDPEWIPGKKSGKRGAIQVIVNISFYY